MKSILELSLNELHSRLPYFNLNLMRQFIIFENKLKNNYIMNDVPKEHLTNTLLKIEPFSKELVDYIGFLTNELQIKNYDFKNLSEEFIEDNIIYCMEDVQTGEWYYGNIDLYKDYSSFNIMSDYKKLNLYLNTILSYQLNQNDKVLTNLLLGNKISYSSFCTNKNFQNPCYSMPTKEYFSLGKNLNTIDMQDNNYYLRLNKNEGLETELYLMQHPDASKHLDLDLKYKLHSINSEMEILFNNTLTPESLELFDVTTLNRTLPNVKLKYKDISINDSKLIKQMALVGNPSYFVSNNIKNNLNKNADYTIDKTKFLFEGDYERVHLVDYKSKDFADKVYSSTFAGAYEDILDFIEQPVFHTLYNHHENVAVELISCQQLVFLTIITAVDNDLSFNFLNDIHFSDELQIYGYEPTISVNNLYFIEKNEILDMKDFKNLYQFTDVKNNITLVGKNVGAERVSIHFAKNKFRHLKTAQRSHNCSIKFQRPEVKDLLDNEPFRKLLESIE